MMRSSQLLEDPFGSNSPTVEGKTVGGSNPSRQAKHDADFSDTARPQVAAQIYGAPALKTYEPVEGNKSDMVDNIYLPPNRAAETAGDKSQGGASLPPSGTFGQQFARWLKTGQWS